MARVVYLGFEILVERVLTTLSDQTAKEKILSNRESWIFVTGVMTGFGVSLAAIFLAFYLASTGL